MVEKIRPAAVPVQRSDEDGHHIWWGVSYKCPKCGNGISEHEKACDNCGTFFDWTKTARVRLVPEVYW